MKYLILTLLLITLATAANELNDTIKGINDYVQTYKGKMV